MSTIIRAGGSGLGVGQASANVIDATRFGMAFDGATDDTAAWNTFLGARSAGDVIALPYGKTSRITGIITMPATSGLTLLGWGCTIKLDAAAVANTIMLSNLSPDSRVVGLTLDGSATGSRLAVRVRGSRQRYESCTLTGGGRMDILGAITDLHVSGCTFNGGGFGILFDSASTATRIKIVGNTFLGGAAGDAIEVNTPTGRASNILIADNIISGYAATSASGIGIGVAHANDITISNNTITSCGLDAVHIEDDAYNISVVGNVLRSIGRSGISLDRGAGTGVAPNNISIVGNSLQACGLSGGEAGIALEGSQPVRRVTIQGNTVRACGRTGVTYYGISLGFGNNRIAVLGNDVSDTIGSTAIGISWTNLTNSRIIGNSCHDTQTTKTQHYGLRSIGTCSDVVITGNDLNGNATAAIDESTLTASVANYAKRNNLPATVDGAVTPALVVPPVVAGVPPGAAAWPSANRASLVRFTLTAPITLRYANWVVGTASGNVQVGVISLSGTGRTSYTRVMSSGVIACPAAGDIHTDLGATSLPAGDYAAFLWADNITFQTRWLSSGGLSAGRATAIMSGLTAGVPASGSFSWGGTQAAMLTIEADV